jgi:hypothetical protein
MPPIGLTVMALGEAIDSGATRADYQTVLYGLLTGTLLLASAATTYSTHGRPTRRRRSSSRRWRCGPADVCPRKRSSKPTISWKRESLTGSPRAAALAPTRGGGGRVVSRTNGGGYERYLLASMLCSSMSFVKVSRISSG